MGEWLPLLVRAEDYAEFAALVAVREFLREASNDSHETFVDAPKVAATTPATAAMNSPDAGLARYPSWSEDALRRLASSEAITAQRWARALDLIASDDEKTWFTTTEVAKRAGMTINEWRDAPRKLPRHMKAHFPDVPMSEWGPTWPLLPWGISGSEVSWAITADTRARWRKIREL